MAEEGGPGWIGERLLGLLAQAVARHDPAHPLDEARLKQPGSRD